MQEEAPVEPPYCPAAQFVHEDAAAVLKVPAAHVEQYVLAVACAAFPAAQSVHAEAPKDEYFPMAQSTHVVEEVPPVYFPDGQLSQVLTPPREKVPPAQGVHPVDADVPTDLGPAEQLMHVDWPVIEVYRPPGHDVQAEAPLKE